MFNVFWFTYIFISCCIFVSVLFHDDILIALLAAVIWPIYFLKYIGDYFLDYPELKEYSQLTADKIRDSLNDIR